MTQLSKAQFTTTYADAAGTFADNTSRDISAGDMQQFSEDIKDSCLFKLDNVLNKVTGTISSAQLLTLGSVPVTIISAPGANKYLAIHDVFVSYNYGSVAYIFSGNPLTFTLNANVDSYYALNQTFINGSSDFNRRLSVTSSDVYISDNATANTAFTLTTLSGADPTPATGDGDLDVVVWYSIEDVNV
jgi:hypothetical protein